MEYHFSMIIVKATVGTILQRFDTETRLFVGQEFVASDEKHWETELGRPLRLTNDEDAALVYGKGGVDEPYLIYEMKDPVYRRGPHNDKAPTHRFKVGDEVLVVPGPDSLAAHEFVGRVIGFKKAWIQVKDQDDNVFDCDVDEVKPAYEA